MDARTNLFDSLLFASEPKAHGVNIVFGGKVIKEDFHLMEAYDMTLEAVVTKLMWILGQTSDPEEIREMFYKTINRDMLFTCAVHD